MKAKLLNENDVDESMAKEIAHIGMFPAPPEGPYAPGFRFEYFGQPFIVVHEVSKEEFLERVAVVGAAVQIFPDQFTTVPSNARYWRVTTD